MCNPELKQDISIATNIIRDNSNYKDKYIKHCVIPARGTENVTELFQKIDNSYEKSLIVTGSGDQALEAILYGAKEIHSFDINALAKHGSALKFAAIEALEYNEFCAFYTKMFPTQLYKKVREFLKGNFLLFWDCIFDYAYNFDVYHSLFNADVHGNLTKFGFSIYESKNAYSEIKDRLGKVAITYATCDLLDIRSKFMEENSYDFVYLSNIFYYINQTPEIFSDFILQNIYPLLKEDGEMILHYLYSVYGRSDAIFRSILEDIIYGDQDIKDIEEFGKYLNMKKYIIESSGYGFGYKDKDVALSLKR